MHRTQLLRPWIVGVALSFASIGALHAQPYTFERRADTSGALGYLGNPGIGTNGTVGFYAQLDTGEEAVLTASAAGILVQLAASGSQFASLGQTVGVNTGGTAVFTASLPSGQSRVYTASPGGSLTIAATTEAGGGLVGFDTPSINASGKVAFVGFPSFGNTRIYTAAPGTAPVIVATPAGSVTRFARTVPIKTGGAVAYVAFENPNVQSIYRLTPGASPVHVADTTGPLDDIVNNGRLALSDSGTIGFVASLDAGGQGLYIASPGGSPLQIANTAGPLSSLFSPAINASGLLTYTGNRDAGGSAIFVRQPGGATSTLIGTGDLLDGSTIVGLSFSTPLALNDAGQIAFNAFLADGRQGIFVASIVPEPASTVLAVALSMLLFLRPRRVALTRWDL